jgi:hypothetical protein
VSTKAVPNTGTSKMQSEHMLCLSVVWKTVIMYPVCSAHDYFSNDLNRNRHVDKHLWRSDKQAKVA